MTIIKIKNSRNENGPRIYSINGVSGFRIFHGREKCWIYNGRSHISNCWIFTGKDWVEIHNVIVHDPSDRKKSNGTKMIADIRRAFPNKHIWGNTAECSRGFWEKMIERGYIDSIENQYNWPCMDTNCRICHPIRVSGKRRNVEE